MKSFTGNFKIILVPAEICLFQKWSIKRYYPFARIKHECVAQDYAEYKMSERERNKAAPERSLQNLVV